MSKEKSGVYLMLFHGRPSPDTEMDDWGSNGPVFGPLAYVHTTYGSHIKLGDLETGDNYGDLYITEGLVYYDGVYYGDWSVFGPSELSKDLKARVAKYCHGKARGK